MKTAAVVVLGAGPGGYVAAIRLAQLGKKVVIVDRGTLGGVCLNWGCIPSKALISAAGFYERVQKASEMGIDVDGVEVDVRRLQQWKSGIVSRLTGGVKQLLTKNGVEIVFGEARVAAPNRLVVQTPEGSLEIEASAIVLATGSRPIDLAALPADGETVIQSREALELEMVPPSLVVVGGGVIGLEIGTMWAKLGSRLTVVELTSQLLPGTDPDLVRVVERGLKKRKVAIHLESEAVGLAEGPGGKILKVRTRAGKEIDVPADKVLVSVGVRPNSSDLGLEQVGVVSERGFIKVDDQLRTSVPSIYAIGDVTGQPFLAHRASKQGLVVADVIAGKSASMADVQAMPAAIFTDPEVATVGLSEAEARAAGHEVRIGTFPFSASGRALAVGHAEGMVKVVADARSDLLLGCGIAGPEASDLIAEPALAIEMGAAVEDLALTVHAHPTLPESMMEAAEAVHGKAIHIFNP
ncbi:MAG: dihydrolipoyl dehydrogenase [Planctomycetota bacterium]